MKYYFHELLACPVCKNPNLILHSIVEEKREVSVDIKKIKCRKWCSLYSRPASETPIEECVKCASIDIVEGVLVCSNCGRWYPIVNSIPVMLNDKYRNPREDEEFLRKHIDKLPYKVKIHMKIPISPL